MQQTETIYQEWYDLIVEAKQMGLTPKEIREYFQIARND